MRRVDLTGQRFGKLIVTDDLGRFRRGSAAKVTHYFRCLCDCGGTVDVSISSLRSGATSSCGCLKSHYTFGSPTSTNRHGKSRTPEYAAWIAIRRRCCDPTYQSYEDYGGRGVTMYDGWVHDFQAFLDYVGERPSPDHSIDRFPDNNGPYAPGNVRWANRNEQCRNRRSSKLLTMNGVSKTMVEWAEDFGIPYQMMKSRIRNGWSLERIKATPPLRRG